jgi:uncharacterized protein YdhG (YjbR/CyaY superfamily)
MKKASNTEEYIAGFSEKTQALLMQIRTAIQAAAPDAEEILSYGMPGFLLGGDVKIWYAAYKKHIGLYPVYGLGVMQDELEPFRAKNTKDTLHFPLGALLPLELIGKIVRMKLMKIESLKQ